MNLKKYILPLYFTVTPVDDGLRCGRMCTTSTSTQALIIGAAWKGTKVNVQLESDYSVM